MIDYTTLSDEQLKNRLKDLDVDGRKLRTKSTEELIKMLKELESESTKDDFFEETENVEETLSQQIEERPSIYDYAWTDWVLSKLEDDEFIKIHNNKCPTVDAVRRLVEKYIGRIVQIRSIVHQCPNPENWHRATVQVDVSVDDGMGGQVVSGVSDVNSQNTDKPFCYHAAATAETKAEGRAYKKILRLRKVNTAEEVSANVDYEDETFGKVTEFQMNFLETLCRDKMNVNVQKVLNKLYPDVNNIKDLRFSEAQTLFKELHSWQQIGIPEDVKGYDNNWR